MSVFRLQGRDMAVGQDEALIAALQRLVAGQASPDDLAMLQVALAEGHIRAVAGDDATESAIPTGNIQHQTNLDSRGSLGLLYQPSGDIQQYFFEISSEVQFKALMDLLQRYTPPQLPPPDTLPDPGPLPPGSRLPFNRNAVFTGREDDLKKLAESLLGSQAAPGSDWAAAVAVTASPAVAAAATGTGGLGKTQLAVEFCYRYGRFFNGVHWLQANLDMLAEIAACGSAMGLTPWPERLPEQEQATLLAWERGETRLVVLDNVEDPKIVADWLPKLKRAKVLLTSRRRDWPLDLGLALLPLDSLPRPESLILLRKLVPRLEKVPDEELDKVADRLGNLPLALDLAGRYLEDRKSLGVEGFLQELEKAGGALGHSALKDWTAHNPTLHATNLAATFSLSWNKLARTGMPSTSQSHRLFRAAGYCAANTPIPWEVFYRIEEAEEGGEQAEVDKSLNTLENKGLVGLAEAGAVIHPLLAEFARLQDGTAEKSALPGLAEALGELSYDANESGLPEQSKPLRAHMESAAGWAEQKELEQAGMLWNNLGSHLNDMAEYAGAKAAYERALRIGESTFGSDHPNVAIWVNNLGGVLYTQGDYAGAQAAYERALRILEKALGQDHPQVAAAVNNLGEVLRVQGDYAGAKAAFERALRIDEAAFGLDHPKIAIQVSNLGNVLQDLGDYAGARAAYERALHIDEATFGPDHPNVAIRVNNVGSVLQALGDYAGGRADYERALAIDEAAFGPDHPDVATDVYNLGSVLQDLGDYAGAKTAYERALAIDEAAFGPDHPDVSRDVNNLGRVLQELGDYAGARAAYERALRIDEAAFGPDHPNVAIRVNNLGSVLRARGDLTGAKAAYERALHIGEAAFGPEHPNVAIYLSNLGNVLQDMGDLTGAKAANERALAIDEATFGPEHPNVAIRVNNLGKVLQDQGDYAGAKAAFERALAILEKHLPPDHPDIQIVHANLEAVRKK